MGKKTREKQKIVAAFDDRVAAELAQKKNSGKTKRGVIHAYDVMTKKMWLKDRYFLHHPTEWRYRGKSKRIEKQRLELVRYLFGKYHVPRFLEEVWNDAEDPRRREIDQFFDWYIAAAQGKSLYKLHSRDILSKKETHQFLQAPAHYSCIQAMWWAKAMCEGANLGHANRLASSRLIQYDINDKFWLSVLRFFVHNPIEIHEINDLLDYLCNEHGENEHFKMKGRSLESVRRSNETWHRLLIKEKQVGGGHWPGVDVPNWLATAGKKNEKVTWTVTQITSGDDLLKEGQAMHHCVSAYKSRCMSGSIAIFSMKSRSPIQPLKRHLTIEVRVIQGMVMQTRGFANRLPTAQERNVLRRWARSVGFIV